MGRKIYLNAVSAVAGIIALSVSGYETNTTDQSSGNINVGVAETIITPANSVGQRMAGYNRGNNTSTGIHDDLFARNSSPYAPQAEEVLSDASLDLVG